MNSTTRPELRYRLALFPLPVVLLPGAPMPLHIFEPRYRELVRDCLTSDRRFGMVFHDWDRSGPFLSEEGTVGCVAEITEHEALHDGRSLLMVRGVDRFRILDGIESATRYFQGLVMPYVDESAGPEADIAARRQRSLALFHELVASLPDPPAHVPRFPTDRELSYLLAQTIDIDPRWQQGLLELRSESERLARLDDVFLAALGGAD